MNDTIFRISALAIFLVGARISSYYRRKADRESGEKVSLKDEGMAMVLALRVTGITIWLGMFTYLINPNLMTWSRLDLPEWLRWTGVLLGLLADGLAYWVFSHLRNNVSPTVATRSNAYLVTSGPYRWVRHPLYMMGLIGYVGFALLAENWFIAMLSLVVFMLLSIRTSKEETMMVEKFGAAYLEYMQRTGRFLPRLG